MVSNLAASSSASRSRADRPPVQTIRFCRSAGGTRIAYARHGQGSPLVVSTCWVSQLEYDLQSPVWRHFVEGLGRFATTIRYDERGHGLSDWDVEDFSFEARIADLEAVVEASGLERFALLGMAQGGPVAVAYAHRHPERVSRLVLFGTYAGFAATPESEELEEAFTRMIQVGWARPEGRFRRVFTDMLMPAATPEQMSWVDELMRRSTSAENAVAFRQARIGLDVTGLLPDLPMATLVLHARGDEVNPIEAGREVAGSIPGARFVTLESANHVLLEQEPATAVFMAELEAFLSPDRTERLVIDDGAIPSPVHDGDLSLLTARERDVLALVAAGRDNRQIADQLVLSVRTVERHLQTVYRKLGLSGSAQRTAAAALVLGAQDYASAAAHPT